MFQCINLTEITSDAITNLSKKITNIDKIDKACLDQWRNTQFISHKNKINKIIKDGVQADELMNDWFPLGDYDIFISHSHQDESIATRLSYAIKAVTGLNCFIDSSVWSFSDSIIEENAKLYAKSDNGQDSYDVKKYNRIYSNVQLMLQSSLAKMIDKSECTIFLNTPKSVLDGANTKSASTYSPWLYYELMTTRLIARRVPVRCRNKVALESFGIEASVPNIEYSAPINHMAKIGVSELTKWLSSIQTGSPTHSLDALYQLAKTSSRR